MDEVNCKNCGYVCDIGGLIGEHTNDCPKCGKNAFKQEPEPGNIGVITTKGQDLYEVTGQQNGLLYCLPLDPPKVTAVCLPSHFWVLLDKMPD